MRAVLRVACLFSVIYSGPAVAAEPCLEHHLALAAHSAIIKNRGTGHLQKAAMKKVDETRAAAFEFVKNDQNRKGLDALLANFTLAGRVYSIASATWTNEKVLDAVWETVVTSLGALESAIAYECAFNNE